MAWARTLPPTARTALLERLYDWRARARPSQLPPAAWLSGERPIWLIQTGRGWGKTLTGSNVVRMEQEAGRARYMAFIERTPADARDTMIEGPTGIMHQYPSHRRPLYEPAKRRLTFPNGAQATIYTAAEPDAVRGGNFDLVWAEELATWKAPETWTNAKLAMRYGAHPRAIITTTPKPTQLMRQLQEDPAVVVTRGNTHENRANLPPGYFSSVVDPLEGSRLGRQEIHGELVDEMPGALFSRADLDRFRVQEAPSLRRIVVGVDPTVGEADDEEIAECGIVVAGLGNDGHGYVLADLSRRASPLVWARTVTSAWTMWHADRVIAEDNNGGEMVALTLRTIHPGIPVTKRRASRSKEARAEPIAALCETGRIHLVGHHDGLEDQLCSWVPGSGESPDRLDAMVWAFTELLIGGGASIADLYGHEHRA